MPGARAWRYPASLAPRLHPPACRLRANTLYPARGSPPARRRGGPKRTQRRPRRVAGPSPASASEPGERLAAVGEAGADERPQLRLGRRRDPAQADEDRVDVRHRVEDGARHGADHAHLARELGEHRRRAVGGAAGLRREPLADLALDHRDLRLDGGQLLHHAQEHGRGDAVGEVRHDLGRRRVERGEVEADRVGEVQGRVGVRVQGVAEGRLELAVDLHHVDMGDAWRQVLRQHAEAAADLEHHVLRVELRLAPDHVEQVRVDQEVLPQLAVGADAERLHAAQARLRRELAHQPNRRAAFASTACSSSS